MPGCCWASPSPFGFEPKRFSDVEDVVVAACVCKNGLDVDVEKAVALLALRRIVARVASFVMMATMNEEERGLLR